MDDLIRRSDVIEEVYKRIGADLDIDDVEYFEKIINSVPTAYNVDKVVEQVEGVYEYCSTHNCNDCNYSKRDECRDDVIIELIKAGGVNG